MQIPQVKKFAENGEKDQPVELFKHQNYSVRRLLQKDRKAGLCLLSQQFVEQEPLINAYLRLFHLKNKESNLKLMSDYWECFIDNSIYNQLSVAVFDLQKNEELIGISIAKNLSYVPQGLKQKIIKDHNFQQPIMALYQELLNQVKPQYKDLLKEKGVMDILALALKKEHTGKKLLHEMLTGNEILGIKQGYHYGFSYATNFKTGIGLSKLNYEKISEKDCRQFEFIGVKPFQLAEQINSRPSLWLKALK